MAAAGSRGTIRYPGACRRAVLLPNYSKHSAIGAGIKGASFPRVFLYLPRVHTRYRFVYLSSFPPLSFYKESSTSQDSCSSDVNLSRERVRALDVVSTDRHREVGITTTGGASAILHGGRRCSRIGTVGGRYAGRRSEEG